MARRRLRFLREGLGPAGVNTLVLRVDSNCELEGHPELRGEAACFQAVLSELRAAGRR